MGKKCLKKYHTYHDCLKTTNIITLKQLLNFPNLGLKYHLPRFQSPVCVGGGCMGGKHCICDPDHGYKKVVYLTPSQTSKCVGTSHS